MARDAYSYAAPTDDRGIVLVALGVEEALRQFDDTIDGELSLSLPILPLTALYGGVALFLFAHVAFKYRTSRHVTVRRLAVEVLLCALVPLATGLPALAALGLVTAILVAMIASEAVRYAEARSRCATGPVPRCMAGIAKPIRDRRSDEPGGQSSARRSSAVALIRAARRGSRTPSRGRRCRTSRRSSSASSRRRRLAAPVPQQHHLAEVIARTERRDGGALVRHVRRALVDDEELVAGSAPGRSACLRSPSRHRTRSAVHDRLPAVPFEQPLQADEDHRPGLVRGLLRRTAGCAR